MMWVAILLYVGGPLLMVWVGDFIVDVKLDMNHHMPFRFACWCAYRERVIRYKDWWRE